jgi:hypothetical protein
VEEKPLENPTNESNRCTKRSLSAHAKEFYLKEYEFLRREVEIAISDYRATERNIVIAVGVSWAWLYQVRKEVPWEAWLVPCLFVVLGILRTYSDETFFRSAHKYLTRVEESFSSANDPGGWEHWEHANVARNWTRFSAVLFWTFLLLSTIAVAIFEICRRRHP